MSDDIIRSLTARVKQLEASLDESYAEMLKTERRVEEERRYFTGAVLTACGVTTFDKGDPNIPSDGLPSVGWALRAVRAVVAERDRLLDASKRSDVAPRELPSATPHEHSGVGCCMGDSYEDNLMADGFDRARLQDGR